MVDYNLIFGFALAFLITFASVPIVRVIAFKLNAVDVPRDNRRMHKKPIPRMGGAAIFLGFIVSVACFTGVIDHELIAILVGALIIVIVGILDDIYQLKPVVKLIGQIVAAIVVIWGGVRIDFFTIPFAMGGKLINLDFLSIPVTFVWIILITNAVNLIDGLDGLAASISGISALALVFLTIVMDIPHIGVVLVAVAGACFGFLPFNQHPAKIFMGDTGALFLGFILSTLSIQGFFKGYTLVSLIIPIIVLGLPLFDTSFAILRRLAKGQGIMHADRGHLHHKLIDKGFSQRETVTMLCTLSSMLSFTAVVLITKGLNRAIVLVIAMVLFGFCSGIYAKNKSIAKEYIDNLNEEENKEENENEKN